MAKLNARKVDEVFSKCSDDKGTVIVRGIIINEACFNKDKLEQNRDTIREMCLDLPEEFMRSGGGGWSFLNMCMDRSGRQWADLHGTMEKLVLLGIALDLMVFLLPREAWKMLPGGMPYIVVNDSL